MNTPHSPFSAPRKELKSRLQKGVVTLLFMLLLAFAGLYILMSIGLEKQNGQQKKLSELLSVVHHAEEHWLELLLVEDKQLYVDKASMSSLSHLHSVLMSEYSLIEKKLKNFNLSVEIDLSDTFVLLESLSEHGVNIESLSTVERESIYLSFEVLEVLGDELMQIGVDLDYERQVFIERLIWGPVGLLLFIALTVAAMSAEFCRQLHSGFSCLHYVLDHHKHGHALVMAPRGVADEFTDLSHLIDNELSSRDFDLNQQNENLTLVEKALSKVDSAFLITNDEGDVVWLSSGAERLWFKNTALFESTFAIDAGLDSPIGERISDSILMSDQELILKLSDGVYCLTTESLVFNSDTEKRDLQCIISIKPKSELAEVQVLHNSLKLLEQDVWDVPIRPLRNESPYASFAHSLESIRQKVAMLFDDISVVDGTTNPSEKITKLQQIASLIDEKSDHNKLPTSDVVLTVEPRLDQSDIELNDISLLSVQLRDSLLLGYELILQRLALVEKDLSSDVFLLGDVDRCLNEVRAGVLSSLSATASESESVRHRFSIDLEHDISRVQEQIEGMKAMAASTLSLLESDRSVGVARLDRARESIDKIVEKVSELMTSTTSNILDKNNEDETIKEPDSKWDNL